MRPDLSGVAHWRYSAYFLARVFQHEVGLGAANLCLCPAVSATSRCIYFGRSTGEDEQRLAIELEDQAVGDCSDFTAQDSRGGGRRRYLLLESLDCVLGSGGGQSGSDVDHRIVNRISNLVHPESRLPLPRTLDVCSSGERARASWACRQRR